jgi:hypothetical protein
MTAVAALLFVLLAAGTIGFHLLIIAGRPWGHLTMGGRWPGRVPFAGRVAAGLSALLLAGMAWVAAGEGGWTTPVAGGWAIWAVAGLMTLSVLMHLATPSAAERRLWLPVVASMAVCALVLALG